MTSVRAKPKRLLSSVTGARASTSLPGHLISSKLRPIGVSLLLTRLPYVRKAVHERIFAWKHPRRRWGVCYLTSYRGTGRELIAL